MTGSMGRWLAAAAVLALTASAATAEAARPRAHVVKRIKHRVVHRVARRTAAAKPVLVPVAIAPLPDPKLAAVPSAPDYRPTAETVAAYRWLDDADAMMGAVGATRPDDSFDAGQRPGYAWRLDDGALVIAERLDAAVTAYFFFASGSDTPFLIQERDRSFGYADGVLGAVFDADGRLTAWRDDDADAEAGRDALYEGRRLWRAAQPKQASGGYRWSGWSISIGGSFAPRWRDNDDWRRYRAGPGYAPHREQHDRWAREHDERARRDRYAGSQPSHDGGRDDRPRQEPGSGWSGGGRPDRARPPVATERPGRGGYGGRGAIEAVPPPVAADAAPAPPVRRPRDDAAEAPGEMPRTAPDGGERGGPRAARPADTPPTAEAPPPREPERPAYREPERSAPAPQIERAPEAVAPPRIEREPERAAPPQPAPQPPAPPPARSEPTPAAVKRSNGGRAEGSDEPPAD